jgi:hypothetical protein
MPASIRDWIFVIALDMIAFVVIASLFYYSSWVPFNCAAIAIIFWIAVPTILALMGFARRLFTGCWMNLGGIVSEAWMLIPAWPLLLPIILVVAAEERF